MQPQRAFTVAVLLLATSATAQQLSRLVDTNPAGNGNARILYQAPTRSWMYGGDRIWRTDGTAAGTQAFHSLGGNLPTGLAEIGNRVYLGRRDSNSVDLGLVVLDTAGQATQLLPGQFGTYNFHELHGQLLFYQTERYGSWPNFGYRVRSWLSDGTAAGTRLAPHIPVDVGNPWPPWRLNGDLISTASDPWSVTLFVTNGLTTAVLTTTPRVGSAPGYQREARSTGRRLFFVKLVPGGTFQVGELWRTDGTPAGTARVYDPSQSGFPAFGMLLGTIGDRVFFVGGTATPELWTSDGTQAGTTRVTTLPGWTSGTPASVDGGIYFLTADTARGAEPMFTDGTAAGTTWLGDLTPGTASSTDFLTVPLGGRRALLRGVFAGRHSVWISEGTPASTQRVLDLSPTLAWTPGLGHVLTRGRYLFPAGDLAGDQEPWGVDGLAVAEEIGIGSPPAGFPRLSATSPILGTTFRILLSGGPANANGVLVLGFDAPWAVRVLPTATLFLDLSQPTIVLPMRTDAQGSWTTLVTPPNDLAYTGATFALQLAVGPTGNPGLGFDLSNGLLLTPGH